jgi:mannose-6-phosphate isomerase-like protein (cupin superfamily)
MPTALEGGLSGLAAEPVVRVEKPWGYELIWASVDGLYVGKILSVIEGRRLSLQVHENKTETMHVLNGTARVSVGPSSDELEAFILSAKNHRSLTIPAGYIHRLEAMTNTTVLEVSTAAPGWQTDVIRLDDVYGREGTNNP